MSLEDLQSQLKKDAAREANNRLKPEYRPHVEMGATNGTAATGLVSTSLIGNDDDLLRLAGLDPAEWCPALECGSDWLTRSNGEYSNPGVLTLRVKDGRTCGLRIFEQE